MPKTMCMVLTLLLGAIVAPCARADSVTFTCSENCVAAVPTAPDVTFPSPTLVISFDSQTLNLTLPSEDLDTDSFSWFTSNNLFIISDIDQPFDLGANVTDNSESVNDEFGTLLFATVSTPVVPEPSSLLLLGTGMIGTFGALRRKVRL